MSSVGQLARVVHTGHTVHRYTARDGVGKSEDLSTPPRRERSSMTIRDMNAYRKAGAYKRLSPRMKHIRQQIDSLIQQIHADRSIPERCGEIITRRYIQGYSIQEVCMETYISERTYFRELHRIRMLLDE